MNSLKIIVEKNLEGLANGDSQLMDYEKGQYVKDCQGCSSCILCIFIYIYNYVCVSRRQNQLFTPGAKNVVQINTK